MMIPIPHKGYKQTAEHTAKCVEGHRQYWDSIRGKPLPYAEKLRQARLQYYQTHDAPNKDIPHTKETKEKISIAMKKWWSKPGIRERMIKAAKHRKKVGEN